MKPVSSISSWQPLLLICTFILGACGGSSNHRPAEPENPYANHAATYIQNGLTAMQRERWQSAERSFSRALTSSQLADDTRLISLSWYNLAVIHTAMKNSTAAERAYLRVIELSGRYKNSIMQMRAHLALALMHQREGKLTDTMQQFPASLFENGTWPADIHLQAARLAQLLQAPALAEQGYRIVTITKGNSVALQKMKGEAHMGLAMMAKADKQYDQAWSEAEQSLQYCRSIGAPRLTAHALLLQGSLPVSTRSKRYDKLERALNIYTALADKYGQKQSLILLLEISDANQTHALRLRLEQLEDKLGKETEKATAFPINKKDD